MTEKDISGLTNAGLTVSKDAEIAITPCKQGSTTNTFVCGLDNGDCKSSSDTFSLSSDAGLVLRPAQVAALVGSALASTSASASHAAVAGSAGEGYTTGEMAGLGAGIAVPLLIALGIAICMVVKEKKRWGTNKHMYKLPENCKEDDFQFKDPPPVAQNPEIRTSQNGSVQSSRIGVASGGPSSRATPSPSFHSPVSSPMSSPRPLQMSPVHSFAERPSNTTSYAGGGSRIQSFAERFDAGKVPSIVMSPPEDRHELDSLPAPERERFELATHRMST